MAFLFAACVAARERSPDRQLQGYLATPSESGNVFAQGTLDGVDYRKLLRGAIGRDAASLAGIFRYTAKGQLMGEGAEANGDILQQLLRVCGDRAYASVLAAEPPKVRKAVIDALDYSWLYPGWRPSEYSLTHRLAQHEPSRLSSLPSPS